jgi:hypothetical protein
MSAAGRQETVKPVTIAQKMEQRRESLIPVS